MAQETSNATQGSKMDCSATKVISTAQHQCPTCTNERFSIPENILGPNCTVPEYSGYNTMLSRQQGHALRARTFAVYTPLTDMVPSDPTTMMTAMVEAQRLTHLTGQNITVFTNNQQLYRVAVNIAGVYLDLFHNFIPD